MVQMINLDKHEIEFPCPKCGFYNKIWLKQACLRDVIICRGCKINIQLDDQMNETKKAIRSIKRTTRELEETINKLSFNFEIRL